MSDKKIMAIRASESGRRTIPRKSDFFAGGAKSGSSKSSLITPRSEYERATSVGCSICTPFNFNAMVFETRSSPARIWLPRGGMKGETTAGVRRRFLRRARRALMRSVGWMIKSATAAISSPA